MHRYAHQTLRLLSSGHFAIITIAVAWGFMAGSDYRLSRTELDNNAGYSDLHCETPLQKTILDVQLHSTSRQPKTLNSYTEKKEKKTNKSVIHSVLTVFAYTSLRAADQADLCQLLSAR